MVERPSSTASELSRAEKVAGVPGLLAKVVQYRPRIVCFIGREIGDAFETAVRNSLKGARSLSVTKTPTRRSVTPKVKSGKESPDIKASASNSPSAAALDRKAADYVSPLLATAGFGLLPYKLLYASEALLAEGEKSPASETLFFTAPTMLGDENESESVHINFNAIDDAPLSQLPDAVEALSISKSSLNQEIDRLISRIQTRRNLAAPIHRIPPEVFTLVLEEFNEISPLSPQHSLLDLLSVCRLWYETIVSAPSLWTRFNLRDPPHIGRLVYQRSKNLPVLLLSDTRKGNGGRGPAVVSHITQEMHDIAMQIAPRVQTVEVYRTGLFSVDIFWILKLPMPLLQSIKVTEERDGNWDETHSIYFMMPPGPPLKKLILCNVRTDLGSPRVASLRSLQLGRAAVPRGISILLSVLANSPQLQNLMVEHSDMETMDLSGGDSSYPIVLPNLKMLAVVGIPDRYCAALLTSIYTPVVQVVSIEDFYTSHTTISLDAKMWEAGNAQTAALLGLTHHFQPHSTKIEVSFEPKSLRITTRVGDVDPFPFVIIHFTRSRSLQYAPLISAFLSQLAPRLSVSLSVLNKHSAEDTHYIDLSNWGPLLTSLTVTDFPICRLFFKQLERSPLPATAYICPNITSFTLVYDQEYYESCTVDEVMIREWIASRWPNDGGLSGAQQPSHFDIWDADLFQYLEMHSMTEAEAALAAAKSSIITALDRMISAARRRRNVAAFIHQLPQEVFVTILSHLYAAYTLDGLEHRMVNLMTINHTWRDVIINSPQLWTVIRSDYPLEFAKLVLERSKARPLSLMWDTSASHHLDKNSEDYDDLLELVKQHAERFCSMKVAVGRASASILWRLSHRHSPLLDDLHIHGSPVDSEPYAFGHWFSLWHSPPLKDLTLHSAALSSWGFLRSSELRSLDISRPTRMPSISEILRILSNSPLLGQLSLRNFSASTHTEFGVNEEEDADVQIIELPWLRKLHIESLRSPYCSSILSRIRPALCDSVRVLESADSSLEAELWLGNGDAMAALLQLRKPVVPGKDNNCEVSVLVDDSQVTIVNNLARTKYSSVQDKSVFIFRVSAPAIVTQALGQFFSALPFQPPPLRLVLDAASSFMDSPLELHPWSSSLQILQVKGRDLCRAVYKQLGQQQWVAGDGVFGWTCPSLTSIELNMDYHSSLIGVDDEESDGVALTLVVQKRWSGREGLAPALQPIRFRVSASQGAYPDIWARVDLIQSIVPAFELRGPRADSNRGSDQAVL
ncbi:hypothetical protein FRB90_003560 [Tulasnella sp. 427]|nr:hypothetical protein FRB90_003560 [Tulasnella sp. 427]